MGALSEFDHLKPVSYLPVVEPELDLSPSAFPPSNLLDLITYTRSHPEIRSAAGGLPSSELHPRDDVERVVNEIFNDKSISSDEIFQYGDPQGNLRYRQIVAENLKKLSGLPLTSDQIITTSGGQKAISLFLEATFKPGNPDRKVLLTRRDTYAALKGASERFDIPLVSVISDKDGIIPEELKKTIKLLTEKYKVIPAGLFDMVASNPSGSVMSDERGLKISEICSRYGINALFDYAYNGIILKDDINPPTLPYLTFKGISASFSSSKIIAPGLRTTHLVTFDNTLKDKYVAIKRDDQIMTPPLNELILWKLLRDTYWLNARLQKVKARYKQGLDASLKELELHKDVFRLPLIPESGMFLYPEIPKGLSSHLLLSRMLTEAKIAYVPGPWTQTPQLQMPDGELLGEPMNDSLFRFCFATLEPNQIRETLKDMAIMLRTVSEEQHVDLFPPETN